MTNNSSTTVNDENNPLFSTNYHIYINHTDAGGIVYHANHLVFFENCRRDWFTKLGLNGYFLPTDNGEIQHFVVSQAQLQYRKAILLDQVIEVRIDKVELKPASIIFYQSIHRQSSANLTSNENNNVANVIDRNTLLSSSKIVIACVQNQLSPTQLPKDLSTELTDSTHSSQSTINSTNSAPIRPVRVPKGLYNTIKQAIDEHSTQ